MKVNKERMENTKEYIELQEALAEFRKVVDAKFAELDENIGTLAIAINEVVTLLK